MEIKHIYWIAALLDGEGCISFHKSPQIQLNMIDLDTVDKARKILRPGAKISTIVRDNRQTQYKITIAGNDVAGWIMTIYPLMSIRKQAQIRETLRKWKEMPGRLQNINLINATKIVAKHRGVTYAEADKILKNTLENVKCQRPS